MSNKEKIRLQKYLALAGVASRRKCEKLIRAGCIKVNGQTITQLGTKVNPALDKVRLKSNLLKIQSKYVYIILNKPRGIVTTCSQRGEKPVTALIQGIKERIFPVGRLDKESTGLLLLTNDGSLTYQLTHPKFQHEKEYLVTTDKNPSKPLLQKLCQGLKILGKTSQSIQIESPGLRRFKIILKEGKNRQIRRMFEAVGIQVISLHRTRVANLLLGNLKPGQWRKLTDAEVKGLLKTISIL